MVLSHYGSTSALLPKHDEEKLGVNHPPTIFFNEVFRDQLGKKILATSRLMILFKPTYCLMLAKDNIKLIYSR